MLRYQNWGLIVAGVALTVPTAALAASLRLNVQSQSLQVQRLSVHQPSVRRNVGLQKVLSTADGGQIFGWDINRNGTDGVLASSQDVGSGQVKVSVETFDQKTAKITKSFAQSTGTRNSYSATGIFSSDIGLVTHFIEPKPFHVLRRYEVMNPVTGGKFTSTLHLPTSLIVEQNGVNQSTATSLLYATTKSGTPELLTLDLATGTLVKTIHLDPNLFNGNNGTQVDQNSVTNQAVLASSPSFGAVGGGPPLIATIDLATGKVVKFNGLNAGTFGSGFVNGLAVDSNTNIAATTTELNAQVEFYNLKTQVGVGIQLPNTGSTSQAFSGVEVASDPVNKLFFIGQPLSSQTQSGSTIYVYHEDGTLLETLNGFNFGGAGNRIAVNPATRTGFVNGPGPDQLQQFTY